MRQKKRRAPATDPAPHPNTGLPERNQRAVWKDRSWEKEGASLSRSLAAGKEGRAVRKVPRTTSKSLYMFLI